MSGLLRAVLDLEKRLFPPRLRYPATPPGFPGGIVQQVSLAVVKARADTADVIVDFTMNSNVVALASRARLGVWRLDAYSPAAGLEATMRRRPVVDVSLYRFDGAAQSGIAGAAYDAKKLASHTQAYLREKSVQLIVAELAKLSQGRQLPDTPFDPPGFDLPDTAALRRYFVNSFAVGLTRLSARIQRKRGLTPNRFRLSVGAGDVLSFDPAGVFETTPRRNTFWADPFLVNQEGKTWCFFEEYDYATCQGQIAVGQLTDNGIEYVGSAMRTAYHMSFPYIFRHGEDMFMIPETVASGRIEVWRATDFPTGWTLHATAMEGQRAADTTLTLYNGDWWLFTNIGHDGFGDNCNELCIFRTSGPDLAWMEPHALNPVVIGADRARNAGRLFERGGKLYRMAQDNSGGIYGYGLKVMEISVLNLTDYSEQCIRHITPEFREGVIGCHHFDTDGERFVMDMLRP